ncbi:hypothetical protein CDL12_18923 [Handroanthus impetiginosus]|uniref:DUF4005 domain-containing protein n=1 Tax=Handroanthus impetiginosus TaxID=429701 RepID=A0A2G9GTB9_9LAMI|nr:hypothetical protein CDL12_18923 [Handroanthus impetiginosus]
MGKASKWFRGLLGLKNTDTHHSPVPKPPTKKKWGFVKSHKEKDRQKSQNAVVPGGEDDNDASKHAIAVAAATAAAAEAAVAAAQAAAAVVQLTSSGRNISTAACVSQTGAGYGSREECAAVMIQSHFRAYLSRRALRALKALVKLQALVRGHLVRKQTAYALRRLQALVRAQVRVRAGRVVICESPHSSIKSSHYNYPAPATPEKFEHVIRARSMKQEHLMMLKRNSSKSRLWEQGSNFTSALTTEDDNRSDKILEVDPGASRRRNLFYSDQNCQSYSTSKDSAARLSPSSGEVQSFRPLQVDDSSPTFYSASSSRRGAFTPTKSDGSCSRSYWSDHPNYMAYTESSKAKVRSLSAPKQRPQFDRSSSTTKRYSVHGYGDSRSTQRVNFANKAYPGSGRLDKLGMPVPIRSDVDGFRGGHWHRY